MLAPFEEEDAPGDDFAEDNDNDEPSASDEIEAEQQPSKRAKKWFEDDSHEEDENGMEGTVRKGRNNKGNSSRREGNEPETLEDLEALAASYL